MTTNLTIQTDDPTVISQLTLLTVNTEPKTDEPAVDPEGDLYAGASQAQASDGVRSEPAYSYGWNEALSTARDEILANFGTLVRTAQEAEQAGDNAQTEVMNLIDQRVSELKR